MSAPTARTARPTATSLDVVTSPVAADMLGAELADLADNIEAESAATGTSRITAARVRGLRRHAKQFADLHAAGVDAATAR